MKIREIRAAGLRGATPEGGWSSELQPDDCVHTLIAVHTDEGLVGWGSAFTNDALVHAALGVLEPLYRDECALEPERVSEKLHQHTFWLGRGGSITHTISGIDIALWDILGQATGQPVGRLLGGRYRDRVHPYASILMEEPERLREHLSEVCAQGFRAIKMGWGPFGRVSDALDEKIVATARETIGAECRLMVDAGGSDAFWENGYKWALRTAEMLAAYNVYWFEEPLNPDALNDYVKLREHAQVPIAGGEVLTRRQSFQAWLDAGAFDIVQPDVTKVGGISEERRIAWNAREKGTRFIPHGWNTALGLAADLQLASAFPETELVEYLTGSPFIDEIVATPWTMDTEGMLEIPRAPGLGIELNRDAVEKYTRWRGLVRMKQIIVHAPYDVRLDDAPHETRPLGPYEMRARTEWTALSPGTETRIYTGLEHERFSYRVQYPFALGYNNVARVVEVGDKVQEYHVGQRIFSRMPHQSEMIVAEKTMDHAGQPASVNVPVSYNVLAPIPDNVASEHAAFTHLFVLGFNALHRAQYRFGENVVVIRYILDRMARGQIDLTSIVTHRFPISSIKDAFELVLRKDKKAVGIVLEWENRDSCDDYIAISDRRFAFHV